MKFRAPECARWNDGTLSPSNARKGSHALDADRAASLHQKLLSHAAGNVTLKVLPRPDSLSTEIVPPFAFAIDFAMARPSPVPRFPVRGFAVVKKRSKIFGNNSRSIPAPSSR